MPLNFKSITIVHEYFNLMIKFLLNYPINSKFIRYFSLLIIYKSLFQLTTVNIELFIMLVLITDPIKFPLSLLNFVSTHLTNCWLNYTFPNDPFINLIKYCTLSPLWLFYTIIAILASITVIVTV